MKVRLIIIFALALSIMACENQEIEVEDFGTTAVYFPFQTPVRTIIQGDYDLGFNDNDNNGKFEIGVRMAGVFTNETDRLVHYELAPDLIDAAALGVDTVNVKVLPSSYYTIEQTSPVTIPSGATDGRIPIQLQDAFFDDPLSFADFGDVHYVIPLKITRVEKLDSILSGVPTVQNPIKIKADDWNPAPKDYTLFGIKFINKYHGKYLRRGADRIIGTTKKHTISSGVTEPAEQVDTTSVYRSDFVVRDEVTSVSTTGRNSASVTNRIRRGKIDSSGEVTINMTFTNNDDITITSAKDEPLTITEGSGKFVKDGDQWGGKNRDVIYIEYQYQEKDTIVIEQSRGRPTVLSYIDLKHEVKDTLVIRNRDVKFEEFSIDFE